MSDPGSDDATRRLPMFPLGTVLFPGAVLPLHIFEPRYRDMMRDLLEGDRLFGVVLIERGHEVGGEDDRSAIGTVAAVAEAEELPDGRWAVASVGIAILDVVEWLPDNPYPQAIVSLRQQETSDDVADLRPRIDELALRLRQLLARLAELGDRVPPSTFEPIEDEVLAISQLCATAPVSTVDKQALLAANGSAARLDELDRVLEGAEELAALRMAADQ